MFNRNLEFCYICGKKFDTMQKASPISMVETYCPYCGAYKVGEGAATILEHPHNPTFLGGKYELAKLRSALFYYLRIEKQNYLNKDEAYDCAVIYDKTDLKDFDVSEMKTPINLEEMYDKYPKTETERLDAVMQLLASFINEYGERHFKSYLSSETDPHRPYDCLYMPASPNNDYEKNWVLGKLEDLQYIMRDGQNIAFTEAGRHHVEALNKNLARV